MASLLRTLWRAVTGRPPKLVCDSRVWHDGVDALLARAAGKRESGAFLLGNATTPRVIRRFLFYEDIDPTCFANGIVEFDGSYFGAVWEECRNDGLSVVADVHVHPGRYGQSQTDRHNPMIAEAGHLALIIPDFAARNRLPGQIGIYEYRGGRQWYDHSNDGERIFLVGWWPTL